METLRGNGYEQERTRTEANNVTKSLEELCEKQKLALLTKKSEILLLKGSLDIRRPPTTKIAPTTMKMKPVVRYLGIHLGTRMNITLHI